MEAELDAACQAKVGRPSIPLERSLRASLLQTFYSIRAERQPLIQDQFSVDCTLVGAWASMKSSRVRDEGDDSCSGSNGGGRNPSRNFQGNKRSNDTHQSPTDGDARLYRKGAGKGSRLCYMGHALMENSVGRLARPGTPTIDGDVSMVVWALIRHDG
ncbi:MAG: hypothetical protein PsegKO_33140 [Pseudohongiellaceae bacterium]